MAKWMPPVERVLTLGERWGIDWPNEPVVFLGDIGIVEHFIHEVAHAVLLDIMLDDDTRGLSDGIAAEIAARASLQQDATVPARYEVETFAVESLVAERLGLPIPLPDIFNALDIQVAGTLDFSGQRMAEARDTGHVAGAVGRVCSIVAPNGLPAMRSGVAFQRLARNGLEITVYPMLLGNARLCVSESGDDTMLNAWCYQSDVIGDGLLKAIMGGAEWDGEGDDPPGGWYRNPMTGRRRPGGDRSKEEVRW